MLVVVVGWQKAGEVSKTIAGQLCHFEFGCHRRGRRLLVFVLLLSLGLVRLDLFPSPGVHLMHFAHREVEGEEARHADRQQALREPPEFAQSEFEDQ